MSFEQLDPNDVVARGSTSTRPDEPDATRHLELLRDLAVTSNNDGIAEEELADARRQHRRAYERALAAGWRPDALRALGIRIPSAPPHLGIVDSMSLEERTTRDAAQSL